MEPHLHPDDIVAKTSDEKSLAVVERTHADLETHTPHPRRTEDESIDIERGPGVSQSAFRKFLIDGVPPKDTVLIRFQNAHRLELLSVSSLKLLDRSLMIGDIVKRNVQDSQSGVVLNTFTNCTLRPMCDITYQRTRALKGFLEHSPDHPLINQFFLYPEGKPEPLVDIPASELQYAEALSEDDLVIYKDWIGRIEAITNNIHIRLMDNSVVEINDESGEHADGSYGSFCLGDVVKTKKGILRTGKWIYGSYNANTPPVGTVVNIRTVGAEVAWAQRRIGSLEEDEPSHILETTELDSADFTVYKRGRKMALTSDQARVPTISNSEIDVRLGLRVRFQDLSGACLKYSSPENPSRIPRFDRQSNLGYDLNIFDVLSFQTTVTVQWQDLSITTERSVNLVPDANIDDEHAAWPSEIVHSLKLHPVLGMENTEQAERVGVVQAVHAADRMAFVKWSPGSHVHYAKDPDSEEGVPPPIVSYSIEPVYDTEAAEVSLYDLEAPAPLNVRRGDICLITPDYCSQFSESRGDLTWLGEIVDTTMSGQLVVRLSAASKPRDVLLPRQACVIAIRSDGTDHGDSWHDHGESEMEDESDSEEEEDWELSDGEAAELVARYEDEHGRIMDIQDEDWESADETSDVDMHDAPEYQTPATSQSATPIKAEEKTSTKSLLPPTDSPTAPASYLVLESLPPADHHYRNEPSSQSPQHMKRTQKEHRILQSSLPERVYVRSYESRLDLLRVLIIGPTETPYANVPFVVDLYLPPSFPSEPPQAFFHSWPAQASIGGTVGRVNPNLYEDGKICLSVLGTWDGDKGESWSPSKSTLLQVLVSLLGLVLVREPYFNEAGYEALVGTEESKRSSALYSERVFLRAKGFLITAISNIDSAPGIIGLDDIIRYLYREGNGPQLLHGAIEDVEKVLEKSDGTIQPDGLTVMSKGACIPLRRVLDSLKALAG